MTGAVRFSPECGSRVFVRWKNECPTVRRPVHEEAAEAAEHRVGIEPTLSIACRASTSGRKPGAHVRNRTETTRVQTGSSTIELHGHVTEKRIGSSAQRARAGFRRVSRSSEEAIVFAFKASA